MKKPPAEYQCLKCERPFSKPKPEPVSCPHCGHDYVKWLNYDAFKLT